MQLNHSESSPVASRLISIASYELHRLCEVVVHLQAEPDLRVAAENFVEADRHLRRDTALPIDEIVERLTRHA